MLDASPSLLWGFLNRFQSPSRCSKDGASADRVSSEQSTLHPRIESPERAKGVRSDSIIKKRDKNMSTETSPLVLLMNQGTAALGRCRECQSIAKQKLFRCPITAEPSACLRAQRRGLGDNRANSTRGQWESTGVIMCYYSGWSSGRLHLVA